MIEELRERLPEELVWQVLKFTSHPCAELIKTCLDGWDYDICQCCDKMINMRKAESAFLFHDVKTICGNCYHTDANGIVSNYEAYYRDDARIAFNLRWGDSWGVNKSTSDRNRSIYSDSDSDTDSDAGED